MMRARYYYLIIRMLPSVTWIIKAYIKFTLIAFIVYFLLHVTFHTASDKSNSLNWLKNETKETFDNLLDKKSQKLGNQNISWKRRRINTDSKRSIGKVKISHENVRE